MQISSKSESIDFHNLTYRSLQRTHFKQSIEHVYEILCISKDVLKFLVYTIMKVFDQQFQQYSTVFCVFVSFSVFELDKICIKNFISTMVSYFLR